MTNNQFTEYLYRYKREDILKIFKYHNINDINKQEELETILYEKILKYHHINKYIKNDQPNMYIIFKIIKNIIINDYKANKKTRYEQIEKNDVEDIEDEELKINIEKYNWIQSEISKINNHFKKNLIYLYFNHDHSLRSLAAATGIGIATIAPVIKNFKLYIQKEIKNKNF